MLAGTGGAVSGAVLCGGASRRMGVDKATLVVDGAALVQRAVDALHGAGADPVVAVGGDPARLVPLGLSVVADRWPGEGPLGGIVTALGQAAAPVVVVLACDLLGVDEAGVAKLVDALGARPDADVAVAFAAGRRQWVVAAWRRRAEPALAGAFARGVRSVRDAAAALHVVEVALADAVVADADTPADLARHQVTTLPVRVGPLPGHYAPPGPPEVGVDIPEIDVDQLEAHWAQGATVLDVREPDEYVEGHVPGAVPIPLATVPEQVGSVPGEGAVYVICAAGGRSRRAAEFLRGRGIDAVNVAGGTRAWIAAGKPVVTGPDPR